MQRYDFFFTFHFSLFIFHFFFVPLLPIWPYVCSNCGQESPKWIGKCPACGQWNTFKEIKVAPTSNARTRAAANSQLSTLNSKLTQASQALRLRDISDHDDPRIDMHDEELNRVLGGGLVPGSIVLLGGEPGIGKSTLTLQTMLRLPEKKILYVSGEESAHQLKMRANRLNSQLSTLNSQLSTLNSQLSTLNSQLSQGRTTRSHHRRLHPDHHD